MLSREQGDEGPDNLHLGPQPHVPKETLSVWGSEPGLSQVPTEPCPVPGAVRGPGIQVGKQQVLCSVESIVIRTADRKTSKNNGREGLSRDF